MSKKEFVNIFGLEVEVVTGDLSKTNPAWCGYYDPKSRKIYIHPSGKTEDLHTLLHEMMHCLLIRCGFMQVIDKQLAETLCENYATMMVENFKLTRK